MIDAQVFKLLCRLDSPDDNEVLQAARALVRNLKAAGSDLRTLSDALEVEWIKQHKVQPRAIPIDYSDVDAAIATYAQDRAVVQMNALLKTLYNKIGQHPEWQYVHRRLQRLGYIVSNSGKTFHKQSAGPTTT
jgi:flavin-dependent dehydrogenase